MLWAVEYQALAADFQLPERLVATGPQGQAFEVEAVAAVTFPLQAIDLADLEAAIAALALTATQLPGQVGEQTALAITGELSGLALDSAGLAIEQHEAALLLTGDEDQLAILDLYLALQTCGRRRAFRLAGIDLAGGQ